MILDFYEDKNIGALVLTAERERSGVNYNIKKTFKTEMGITEKSITLTQRQIKKLYKYTVKAEGHYKKRIMKSYYQKQIKGEKNVIS